MDGALDLVYPRGSEHTQSLNEEIPLDSRDGIEIGDTRTQEPIPLIEVDFRVKPPHRRGDLSNSD